MSLNIYLTRLLKFNPLPYNEFLTLLKKAQKGNRKARNKIVEHNLRLVVFVAKKYVSTKISIEDLIAEGSLGLFEALSRFKYSGKNKFSTYAFYWIKQKITRYIDNTINLIRKPVWVSDVYRKSLKNGKQKKKTEKLLRLTDIKITSLYATIGYDSEFLDLLGVTYPITEEIDSRLILETLQYLTPRNKSILEDRMKKITLNKVGKKYKLSQERIRQIEKESIDKIKEILLDKDLKT